MSAKGDYVSLRDTRAMMLIPIENVNDIYFKPGTKLKCQGTNVYKKKAERKPSFLCNVIEDCGSFILVQVDGKGGSYKKSINKIDIACRDLLVKKVS